MEISDVGLERMQIYLKQTAFGLKPSQSSVCLPVLKRIMDKINRGAKFSPIHVVDDLIINGHHRYLCYSFLNLPIETTTWRSSKANEARDWKDMTIEAEDWDNPEDILKHENDYFEAINSVKNTLK